MKNILLFSLLLSSVLVEASPSDAVLNSSMIVKEAKTEKTMYRKRRKRGFFWKLFHKNDCGCPKH